MSEKDKVYYYSHELIKTIMMQSKFQSEVLREVVNSLIKDSAPEGVINIGLDSLKLCNFLQNKIKKIEEKQKIENGKIAISDTELKDIRELVADIEVNEFLLTGCGISVMFH